MKKICLVISGIFLIFITTNAQFKSKNFDCKSAYIIVKDSVWLGGQNIWKNIKFMGQGNNPMYKIQNESDARKFDFEIVPFYKINSKGINFQENEDITKVIELDTTAFWTYIKIQNQIVGHIVVFPTNNKWMGFEMEVFTEDSPLLVAYKTAIRLQASHIFTVKYLEGLWMIVDNKTKVYSFYDKKIMDASEYIKKHLL